MKIKAYAGLNIDELELLGSGTQGKVYRIDADKCIKVFKRRHACRDEYETLVIAQGNPHFPILYEHGDNYIIRECINGISLDKFLKENPLTIEISNKLVGLYEAMDNVGFNRLDTALFHIFVTETGELRLIDTAKALKKQAIYPEIIINSLDKLGYKNQFLGFVEALRPDLFNIWLKDSPNLLGNR